MDSPPRSRDLRILGRTLGITLVVGMAVGFAACLFHFAIQLLSSLLLDRIMHLNAPHPLGESAVGDIVSGHFHRWMLLVIPPLGGLACGIVCQWLAPEAAGSGGDSMIDAFHNKGGAIRARVPLVKGLASVLILGSGGSAGREGPIMQIGSGFGSWIGRLLGVSDRNRRLLVLAGTAAGMAAIFRTPLGAAIFAIEVLYRDEFEAEGIVPAIIASVTAYSIFITVVGAGHLFGTAANFKFSLAALPLYVVMAFAMVGAGKLFVFLLHDGEKHVWHRLPVPVWVRPAIGGLAMGLIAMVVPQAAGIGYGWLQEAILWTGAFPLAWKTVVLLLGVTLAKMLATSCTIGSGGSGGDFGPSLVIGGMLGAAFGQAFHLLMPSVVPQPGAFALVGMATFYGGIAHVPLASLIMVCELTGSYDLLVPLMLTGGVAVVLLRRTSLYQAQVANPIESPAHAGELAIDILSSLRVADAFDRSDPPAPVPMNLPLRTLLDQVPETHHATFTVSDTEGLLVGMVSLENLRSLLYEQLSGARLLVRDAMDRLVTVAPHDTLSVALDRILTSGYAELPVAAADVSTVLGVIGHTEIVRAYNRELARRRGSAGAREAA